jgi:hypothetical protein
VHVYLKYRYRCNKESKIQNFTSVIREIPEIYDYKHLYDYFQIKFPSWKIVDIKRTFDSPKLNKKFVDREGYVRNLESAIFYFKKKGTRKKIKNG